MNYNMNTNSIPHMTHVLIQHWEYYKREQYIEELIKLSQDKAIFLWFKQKYNLSIQEAEDIFQDAVLSIIKAINKKTYEHQWTMKAYFYMVITNKFLDAHRRKGRLGDVEDIENVSNLADLPTITWDLSIQTIYQIIENLNCNRDWIETLKMRIDGLRFDEIRGELGYVGSTGQGYISKIRKLLAEALVKQWYLEDIRGLKYSGY